MPERQAAVNMNAAMSSGIKNHHPYSNKKKHSMKKSDFYKEKVR